MPGIFTIQWTLDEDIPAHTRASLPLQWRELKTNGDGACALHAVFGSPNEKQELFFASARQRVVEYLVALPETASNNPAASMLYASIKSSL